MGWKLLHCKLDEMPLSPCELTVCSWRAEVALALLTTSPNAVYPAVRASYIYLAESFSFLMAGRTVCCQVHKAQSVRAICLAYWKLSHQ